MILCCSIYCRPHESYGELLACAHIVRAAADLNDTVYARINIAHMKMRAFDGLTGLNQTDNNFADVFSDLIFFLNLETAREKLLLKDIGADIYINIIF